MEDKKAVLSEFTQEIQRIFGENLIKVILYGSYARGDFQNNSDMDI
jgi:predicted nucleotidyltransferase